MIQASRSEPDYSIPVRKFMLAGLGGFVFFLVAMFNARVAWILVSPNVANIELVGIEGSLWWGKAETLYLNREPIGSISWRWRPSGLLRGQWSNAVELAGAGIDATGSVGIGLNGTLAASGMEGSASLAGGISRFLPAGIQVPAAVDANLDFSLSELVLRDKQVLDLAGQVATEGLRVEGKEQGTLRVVLRKQEQGIAASIFSEGDPSPGVEGDILLSPDGDYRLDVSVDDPYRLGGEISAFVRGFGLQGEDSKWRINWSGRL